MFLILISLALAWPATHHFMSLWLNGFAYRVDLNPWLFVGAGFGALLLALITINSIAFRQACKNPLSSLKHE
jgi:putative ABC transport system permease protein